MLNLKIKKVNSIHYDLNLKSEFEIEKNNHLNY